MNKFHTNQARFLLTGQNDMADLQGALAGIIRFLAAARNDMTIRWLPGGRSGDSQRKQLRGTYLRIATSSLLPPTKLVISSEARNLQL